MIKWSFIIFQSRAANTKDIYIRVDDKGDLPKISFLSLGIIIFIFHEIFLKISLLIVSKFINSCLSPLPRNHEKTYGFHMMKE